MGCEHEQAGSKSMFPCDDRLENLLDACESWAMAHHAATAHRFGCKEAGCREAVDLDEAEFEEAEGIVRALAWLKEDPEWRAKAEAKYQENMKRLRGLS